MRRISESCRLVRGNHLIMRNGLRRAARIIVGVDGFPAVTGETYDGMYMVAFELLSCMDRSFYLL